MRELTSGVLVSLPWTWQGPTHQRDGDGNEWWEVRVAELEDFFVAADSEEAVIAEAGPALEAFLDSFGDPRTMPLPKVIGNLQSARESLATAGIRELQVA